MAKSMKVGGGGRFEKLEKKLSKQEGVRDPGALAASIGRKKFGAKKFASLMPKGFSDKGNWGDVGVAQQAEAKAVGGFQGGTTMKAPFGDASKGFKRG